MTRTVADVAPGDPDEIQESAHLLNVMVTTLSEAATEVRGSLGLVDGSDVLSGEGGKAFTEAFRQLPDKLDSASDALDGVQNTLADWKTDLADLQRRAREALARADLAREAKRTAQSTVDDASATVTRLTRDLETARATEKRCHTAYDDAKASNAPTLATAKAAWDRSLATYRKGSADLAAAKSSESTAKSSLEDAESDLRAADKDLDAIADEHDDEARRVARRIHDAHLGDLRNKDWWEKAWDGFCDVVGDIGNFVKELGENLVELAKAIADGDLDKVLFYLAEVLDAVATILAVVAIVVAIVGTGGMGLMIAGVVVSAVAFAAKAWMYQRKTKNPKTGQLAVTGADLLIDGAFLVLDIALLGHAKMATGGGKSILARAATRAPGTGVRKAAEEEFEFWVKPTAKKVIASQAKSISKGLGEKAGRVSAKHVEKLIIKYSGYTAKESAALAKADYWRTLIWSPKDFVKDQVHHDISGAYGANMGDPTSSQQKACEAAINNDERAMKLDLCKPYVGAARD